jgi:hypothetical protein
MINESEVACEPRRKFWIRAQVFPVFALEVLERRKTTGLVELRNGKICVKQVLWGEQEANFRSFKVYFSQLL